MTMPVGLVLIFTAKLLVPLAYGAQWLPAAPVVAGLTLAAVLRSLSSHAGNIFKATGRPYLLTQIGIIRAIVLIPALIYGAKFGITGVSLAQAAITGASTLVTLFIATRILEIPAFICLKELRPALMGTVGMGLVLGITQFLAGGWPPLAVLVTTLGTGLMGYAGALYIGSPEIIRSIQTGIASVLGRSA
jgi:PST family polysaccharide transporter